MTDTARALIDFETKSVLNVKKVGAAKYAEHPSTEILCMSWKIETTTTALWIPGLPFPQQLIDHAKNGGTFEAHNVGFEFWIWVHQLFGKLGIPVPVNWVDTLAVCAYRTLPLGLDQAGSVLALDIQKDKRGKYLLQRLSSPRKPNIKERKEWAAENGDKPMPILWTEDYDLLEELYSYCMRDVDSEYELGSVIGDLPVTEQKLWVLDQKINQRGVYVDVEAVDAALFIIADVEKRLTEELRQITNQEIQTAGQRDKIIAWIGKQGLAIGNLTKDTLERMVKADDLEETEVEEYDIEIPYSLPKNVRRVIEIRQQLSKASTKKLNKILECICDDGRLHGMFQYHGATTGRWVGRLVQLQNLVRGNAEYLGKEKNGEGMERLIWCIKQRSADFLTIMYGSPMDAIATALRGMFIAQPGNVLYVADFAAVEARVTMWLADQEDALEAFRKYDNKEGPDIYCVMAEKLYKRPIDKEKDPKERQLGKLSILGAGFGMGAEKMMAHAAKEGVIIDESMAKFLIDGYRGSYNMVPDLWRGLEKAAMDAVERPGEIFRYKRIAYQTVTDRAGKWITAILPNGRRLWYRNPETKEVWVTYKSGDRKLVKQLFIEDRKGSFTFQKSIWGGVHTENVVQAVARDLLACAIHRVEALGYSVILHAHDEPVAEVPEGFGSIEEYTRAVAEVPSWAKGCPIAAEGWKGFRYRK